jgi:hypothetical protein
MPASVGPPGTSKGSATTVAPRLTELERGSEVPHLHVQGHPGAIALTDVATGPGLGSTDPGRDVHDVALADLPVEQRAVEGAKEFGVFGFNLPMHDRTCPVFAHPAPSLS